MVDTPSLRRPNDDGIINNNGFVKVNFTGFDVSLVAGVEYVIAPSTPLVYSPITVWPQNSPCIFPAVTGDDAILDIGETYGTRRIENERNRQAHRWRVQIEYTRSSVSTDEQIFLKLSNPVSGFATSDGTPLLRNSNTNPATFDLKTYADEVSIKSNGIGAGYNMSLISTIDVDVSIISITRESVHTSRIIPFSS